MQAFKEVLRDREVRDIWHDLGLEELDEPRDDDMSGGLRGSDVSDSAEPARSADEEFGSDASDTLEESLAVPDNKRRLTGLSGRGMS